jgi:Xaa-Pro aminopeptidase
MILTRIELEKRINDFIINMNLENPVWDTAIIINKVNQYYYTGTMQDGMLVIKKDGSFYYFARRSYERAKIESPLKQNYIYPMESYRDVANIIGSDIGNTYFELEVVPFNMLERIKKYLNYSSINSLDRVISMQRAVKSEYELYWQELSGKLHLEFAEKIVPNILKEAMSEAEFVGEAFNQMIKLGYQGATRFSMFQTDMGIGQVAFGTNSLFPTNFDGPGGSKGMYPAVPIGGDPNRFLKKGDLVFVDIGFGINGYHTDKTQVYMFGASPNEEVINTHRACMDIQKKVAALLKPGNIPSDIYNSIMNELSDEEKENFMGFKERRVKFLGHGIGLNVDELPVIANGFNIPLKENMVIAIEPKKGIENVGTVGVEDTYIVTQAGGKCITGGGRDIIIIK